MLNRVLSRNLRSVTLISSSSKPKSQSQSQFQFGYKHIQNPSIITSYFSRHFSTTNGGPNSNNGDDFWKIISSENNNNDEKEETIESIFGDDVDDNPPPKLKTAVYYFKDWDFKNDADSNDDAVFDIPARPEDNTTSIHNTHTNQNKLSDEEKHNLDIEEKALSQILDSDRAFGDLIAASGITDDMLDSLMALKDFDDVPGLPPLATIEDMRYQKNTTKSTRADIERQKQEEIAAARVRQVDSLGRAYGTGKRKCSIARVWIEPGEGKFVVNDKQFDVYFPMLDQRAALLRPLSETKTLGLLDVSCTVKGGGMSGQIGAIRLGMSRALQNWAPDQFRPPLKEAGFLTRDSRIVERKKPGKAKARKSFQWVKR